MILADTRHRLTRDDAQLAARLLATEIGDDPQSLESRIADEGIDVVLDDPRLAGALLRQPRGAHASLALFTYVMIRQALRRAGEDDRGVADYVSGDRFELCYSRSRASHRDDRRRTVRRHRQAVRGSRRPGCTAQLSRAHAPRQLRALVERHLSRLHRAASVATRRAGSRVLRADGSARLRARRRSPPRRGSTGWRRLYAASPSILECCAQRSTP